MVTIIKLLRLNQWIKNAIIFTPLLFSKNIFDASLLKKTILSFLAFSLIASGVYIFNDLVDAEKDRLHPRKRKRPIASGSISFNTALLSIGFLFVGGITLSIAVNIYIVAFLAIYILINFLYTIYLKHIVIVDVLCISIGFVLRIFVGAYAIDVIISHWIILCTFLLSLFLSFAKRRHELLILEKEFQNHRPVLEHYNFTFLDQMIAVVTSATVVSYSIYTVSVETVNRFKTENLIYTIPFVMYGIFRYLYLVYTKLEGGNPSSIFYTDIPLIINCIAWAFACVIIIYFSV